MVSAVFHSPLGSTTEKNQAQPIPKAEPGKQPAPAKAPRQPVDWRGIWLKVLPPVIGIALVVGIWALLTMKSTSFPTPAATFTEAVKVFSDPFYSKGPVSYTHLTLPTKRIV